MPGKVVISTYPSKSQHAHLNGLACILQDSICEGGIAFWLAQVVGSDKLLTMQQTSMGSVTKDHFLRKGDDPAGRVWKLRKPGQDIHTAEQIENLQTLNECKDFRKAQGSGSARVLTLAASSNPQLNYIVEADATERLLDKTCTSATLPQPVIDRQKQCPGLGL